MIHKHHKLFIFLTLMSVVATAQELTTYYQDYDGDGYGNAMVSLQSIEPMLGYVVDNTDCNDTISVIYPGAPEFCNGGDESCDGIVDENPVYGPTFYLDADGDGFGNQFAPVISCWVPQGYSDNLLDCDDNNAALNPLTPWYGDVDGDGFGNPDQVINTCTPPGNFLANCGDCVDYDATVNPDAFDVAGNSIDDDCNGIVDDVCANPVSTKVVHYSTTSVIISWTASNDAEKYQIQTRPAGGAWSGFTGTQLRYVKRDGLIPGASYEYRIRTLCNGSWTAISTPQTFTMTTGTAACGRPVNGDQFALGPYTTRFFWNYVPGTHRYRFRIRPVGGTFELRQVAKLNGVIVPETGVTGLMAGTSYQYQVQALCGTGTSASDWSLFSPAVTFTTLAADCSTLPSANNNSLQLIHVDQNDTAELSIFPNPTDGLLNIQTRNGDVLPSVEVYSLSGSLLLEVHTVQAVNVASLPAGAYILRATTADGISHNRTFIRL